MLGSETRIPTPRMAMILFPHMPACLCTHPTDTVGTDAAQPFPLWVQAAPSHDRDNGQQHYQNRLQRSSCHPKQHDHFSGIPESKELKSSQGKKRQPSRVQCYRITLFGTSSGSKHLPQAGHYTKCSTYIALMSQCSEVGTMIILPFYRWDSEIEKLKMN